MYLGTIESFSIDFEVDASMVSNKINHAALVEEGFILTHEEHACLRQGFDGGLRVLSFGAAEKYDMA
jgi:hypothetical protein